MGHEFNMVHGQCKSVYDFKKHANTNRYILEWIMKYHLYDEQERHQGRFESVEQLRRFLCDRKYDTNCDKDIGCTFDYIKHIKWYFDIEE